MTKFEQIGVNYQLETTNKEEARKCFKLSCRSCCNRGMRIDCNHCAISQTHDSMIAAFDTIKELEERKQNAPGEDQHAQKILNHEGVACYDCYICAPENIYPKEDKLHKNIKE